MDGRSWLAALCVIAAGCGAHEMAASWNELSGDAYALDGVSREASVGGEKQCAQLSYVSYTGTRVPYGRPVHVAEPFVARLEHLDRLVAETALAHYGRTPAKLRHFGALACRSVRGSHSRLSEHALGNAIDISGFDFTLSPRGATRCSDDLQHIESTGEPWILLQRHGYSA